MKPALENRARTSALNFQPSSTEMARTPHEEEPRPEGATASRERDAQKMLNRVTDRLSRAMLCS
jgi:hypothetical protein